MTFAELVSHYGLARSEGLVLRYLADAYRALRQTVPAEARTEELEDLTEWLGELIRQVDSSLLDEWEQLTNPGAESDDQQVAFGADIPRPITANARAFKVMVRNAMFRRVELASRQRWDELAALGDGLDADDWADCSSCTSTSTTRSGPARPRAARCCSRSPSSRRCGGSDRSSRTRTATTGGRYSERSTWRSPTRPARSSSTNSRCPRADSPPPRPRVLPADFDENGPRRATVTA